MLENMKVGDVLDLPGTCNLVLVGAHEVLYADTPNINVITMLTGLGYSVVLPASPLIGALKYDAITCCKIRLDNGYVEVTKDLHTRTVTIKFVTPVESIDKLLKDCAEMGWSCVLVCDTESLVQYK
jgi:hypothetical protein